MSFKKIILIFILLLTVLFGYKLGLHHYLSLEFIKDQQGELSLFYQQNPLLMVLGFFIVYVVLTAVSFPGAAVLTLLGGALFGAGLGTLIISFASTIGATLAFLGARYLFRDTFQNKFGDRLQTFNEGIRKDGAFYLFTLRLIPVVPFFVINIVMGLTPMRVWPYYVVSQLGMLPGTFVYVYAGRQLAQIENMQQIFSPEIIFSFVLLGVFPYIAKYFVGFIRNYQATKKFRHRKPKSFDYNLVAIGGGAAGLVTAYIGAAAKAKVALIERDKMGGDCLNTGCVPSKALIRTAKFLADVQKSKELGVRTASVDFQFSDIMNRVAEKIKLIEPHDSIERYTKMGVECITGEAKIISPWEVQVGEQTLKTKNIVIATGAEPYVPAIEGLKPDEILTSENLWRLKEKPQKLLILGGGYIGCELAQAFSRIGCDVTLVERSQRLLSREDEDVSQVILDSLLADKVKVLVKSELQKITPSVVSANATSDLNSPLHQQGIKQKFKTAHIRTASGVIDVECSHILVALGRRARTKGFGLENLGIETDERGLIKVDEFLRTTIPNIYACGDCMSPYPFTHMAAHQAWFCAVNAMLAPFYSFKVDYRIVPACMYTDPEVATVGFNETRANEAGLNYEVAKYDIDDLDRAIVDSHAKGFVKVLTAKGSDRILGVNIVGFHAGEYMSEFVLAMKHNIGLNKILGTIHAYPTYAEANKYVAGNWKKAHVAEETLRWAERFNSWRRG